MKQLIAIIGFIILSFTAQSQTVDSVTVNNYADSLRAKQVQPIQVSIPPEIVEVFTREVIVEGLSKEPFSIKKVWIRVRKPLILLTATYLINLAGHKGWVVFSF